ncbi:COMM domain-containing protein 7-like isoform X1 [Clavelina lepadiformis]|uniref:COMM domain-containing protein 7-like isoform X1 n=1 Tax=Clavelina lepadiformis TaxID=159417 RepID=UPI0040411398
MTGETTSLHFSDAHPPTQFYVDAKFANSLNNQQYEDILSRLFAFTHNPDLGSDLGSNLQHYCLTESLPVSSVKDLFKTLLIVARGATKNKLTGGQLYSDLQRLGLDAGRANLFCQTWKDQSEVSDQFSKLDLKRLVDLEWKFGVTAASSELHRVGNCYIQLKMVVTKDSKRESVLMELSLPQFYTFMHEMETAKLEMGT